MKRRLVTSALPYVNNIPHLGNLIQVLSADVFARYCRLAGYETLYICGTDEYGTATETKALEEGVTPKQLCDRFHVIHRDIYKWFNIAFDHFGRTSDPKQTEITQQMFLDLDKNGFIKEQTIEQLYSASKDMFLADRYVRGTCPHCQYKEARGDQCESCGKLLEPTELIDPWSPVAPGETLQVRPTKHLYIDLPQLKDKLEAWIGEASVRGNWARNAVKMTEAWIRDGLKERAITRDLKWGIPVPKAGFENKVFYVWFDAPIGYISMTATLRPDDWKTWWQNPANVELFQFIGKDNIPFHTVVFPSSQLGSGQNWTMLHTMSSSEYLNYESGKFSKSAGVGVFGSDAVSTGIAADVWRFYLFYNRPEKSDTLFTWKDFQERVNSDLVGNFGNLVNRTLTFAGKQFNGQVPEGTPDPAFWTGVHRIEAEIKAHFEKAELRDALKGVLELADLGNKRFQDGEPWKLIKENPAAAANLLRDLIYLVRDLAVLASPFVPGSAEKIAGFLGLSQLDWSLLGQLHGLSVLHPTEILFKKLEDKEVEDFKEKFAGSQADRAAKEAAAQPAPAAKPAPAAPAAPAAKPADTRSPEDKFRQDIDLRVVKIVDVKQHPNAEKLFIEQVDLGNGQTSQIVSGLAKHYKPEELLGRHVILAANLKPAKLRGEMSNGMLLAASSGEGETEVVEVLFPDWAPVGSRLVLQGDDGAAPAPDKIISIDTFFEVPIRVEAGTVKIGSLALLAGGKPLNPAKVHTGEVG